MSEPITITDRERVRTLTMNRPDALNAMNEAMFHGLDEVLVAAENDPAVAVCILTGAGRAFCAGQDLDELKAHNDEPSFQSHFPNMMKTLTAFKKPLIAAVNGLGVGVGMTVLAHCDLVVMAESARLRTPFPQLGLAPEFASSYTFPTRLGWQDAAYVLLSGRWFSAAECRDMGLAWRIVADDSLQADTFAIAREIAVNPIPSLIATKQLLLDTGRPAQAWAAHSREAAAYEHLLGAPANREALDAFAEKREADFSSIPGL